MMGPGRKKETAGNAFCHLVFFGISFLSFIRRGVLAAVAASGLWRFLSSRFLACHCLLCLVYYLFFSRELLQFSLKLFSFFFFNFYFFFF